MIRRSNWQFVSVSAVVSGLLPTQAAASAQEKVDPAKIPAKVLGALKARFPKAEIHQSTKEKEGRIVVYDLEFTQKGRKFEADITVGGTIVNWEKGIAARDLSEAVKKSVEEKYPKSSLKEIMEVTAVKSGKDVPEGFEVLLETAGKKKLEVTVARNGKFLEEPSAKK
jgi:hypothetical protein